MLQFPENLISGKHGAEVASLYHPILSDLERILRSGGKMPKGGKVAFWLTERQIAMVHSTKKGNSNGTARGNSQNTGQGFGSVRWLNVHLSDEDKRQLAENSPSLGELAALVCDYVAFGWSVTLKPEKSGNGFMCIVIGACSDNPDVSVGVSGYGNSPVDALTSLCFKVTDKLGGQLPLPDTDPTVGGSRFR